MDLGLGEAGSNVSAAAKPTVEAPKDAPDADTQSAEDLVVAMLRNSSYPDVGCWYFLTLIEKSASARKYRCSTSPGSIQDIVFSTRNGGVTIFELVHP